MHVYKEPTCMLVLVIRDSPGIDGLRTLEIKCLMVNCMSYFAFLDLRFKILISWRVLRDKIGNFIHLDHRKG